MENTPLKRRDFLRIVGIGSVVGLAAYMMDRNNQPTPTRITETRFLMGTLVNLTLITEDEQAGRVTIAECLDHMEELERILSRYQAESQLSQLNRNGYLDYADTNLVTVLREAIAISALTEGAFDVTVKPLIDLYQNGMLSSPAIATELAQVGYQYLDVQPTRVAFSYPGMAITLDGIAKGYIVDEGVSILQQHGFQNVLVEAGGDLVASGKKAESSPWHIGIQSPRQQKNRLISSFSVSNQAAATSGNYRQAYSNDLMAHHIVDPRTGRSSPELASATVVAPNAMLADALATSVMVMGPEHGLELIERLNRCEAYLVANDSNIIHSSGFETA